MLRHKCVIEISKFQQAGVDNREIETNHNDESPTFDEEREHREIRENIRTMSISSRPIEIANFHVRTFHYVSVSFVRV